MLNSVDRRTVARRAIAGVGLMLSIAGCAPPSAGDVCRAHPYGDMRQDVVGAFGIDASRADAIAGKDLSSDALVDRDAGAVMCFVDAIFGKSPPGAHRPFDRGVYVVIGEDVRLVKLGYREYLEIVDPNSSPRDSTGRIRSRI